MAASAPAAPPPCDPAVTAALCELFQCSDGPQFAVAAPDSLAFICRACVPRVIAKLVVMTPRAARGATFVEDCPFGTCSVVGRRWIEAERIVALFEASNAPSLHVGAIGSSALVCHACVPRAIGAMRALRAGAEPDVHEIAKQCPTLQCTVDAEGRMDPYATGIKLVISPWFFASAAARRERRAARITSEILKPRRRFGPEPRFDPESVHRDPEVMRFEVRRTQRDMRAAE